MRRPSVGGDNPVVPTAPAKPPALATARNSWRSCQSNVSFMKCQFQYLQSKLLKIDYISLYQCNKWYYKNEIQNSIDAHSFLGADDVWRRGRYGGQD